MKGIAYNVPRVGDAALTRCAEPPYEARPSTAAKRGAQALTRCYMKLRGLIAVVYIDIPISQFS